MAARKGLDRPGEQAVLGQVEAMGATRSQLGHSCLQVGFRWREGEEEGRERRRGKRRRRNRRQPQGRGRVGRQEAAVG